MCAHWISLLRPRNSGNLKPWDPARDALLEIGPERRRFRRHGNRDAEAETPRETENLAAWNGDSGRGPARGRSRVLEGAGRQNFKNSVFQKADAGEIAVGGKKPFRTHTKNHLKRDGYNICLIG